MRRAGEAVVDGALACSIFNFQLLRLDSNMTFIIFSFVVSEVGVSKTSCKMQ